jgi:hypothetical protein
LDLPVQVLGGEFAKVFEFLGVVGVHLGHSDVEDGLATVGDIVVWL